MSDKTKKDVVININPFHCEIKTHRVGFSLWFYGNVGDDYRRRKIVKVHFDDWWCKYIAGMLWKLIQRRRIDIDELEQGMIE